MGKVIVALVIPFALAIKVFSLNAKESIFSFVKLSVVVSNSVNLVSTNSIASCTFLITDSTLSVIFCPVSKILFIKANKFFIADILSSPI